MCTLLCANYLLIYACKNRIFYDFTNRAQFLQKISAYSIFAKIAHFYVKILCRFHGL